MTIVARRQRLWPILAIVRQHRFVGAAMAGIGVFGIALVNTGAAVVAIANGGIGPARPTSRISISCRRRC